MRHGRFLPLLSRRIHLPLLIAAAILCLSQIAEAQSGRRPPKSESPPVKSEPAETQTANPSPTPSRGATIIVTGDLVHNMDYMKSSDVDDTIKLFMAKLKEQRGIVVTKGGKMDLTKAKERAKKETEAYVLWFEIGLVVNPLNDAEFVCFMDYAVLMPQTAKFLIGGRVSPRGEDTTLITDTVLRLPKRPTRIYMEDQLEMGVKTIVARLLPKL